MSPDRTPGALATIVAGLLFPFCAVAAVRVIPAIVPPDETPPVTQLIVKFKRGAGGMNAYTQGETRAMTPQRLEAATQAAGIPLRYRRAMSGQAHVVSLPRAMSMSDAADVAKKIAALSDVEYAEPDVWMYPTQEPDDPYYATYQWHYKTPAVGGNGAANLPGAWDITTGSASVVVGVIDTGVLNHTDLAPNLVGGSSASSGYDMISDASGPGVGGSGDNDVRDGDPTDPGDWVSASDTVCGTGTQIRSSWHGTHVSGTIAAISNNARGVAGVAWNSKILMVRALGTCGGFMSDIADGIVWASGGSVPGVPPNANPAKVINMSLGGKSSCDTTTQNAINTAINNGATVVVAAGNSNTKVGGFSPANCRGVVTVAAVGPTGARAPYSNYDYATSYIALAAPGGDMSASAYNGVLSTYDGGTTTANNDNIYAFLQGTSMATPHVSGVVALMLAANSNLTDGTIPANQVASIIKRKLRATARPFPSVTGACTTARCGAGILDAATALHAVTTPPIVSAGSDASAAAGSPFTLHGTATDYGPITYQWVQTAGPAVTLSKPATAQPYFTAPAEGQVLTFQMTATNDVGLSSNASVNITTIAARATPVSSGGGGGGALDWLGLGVGVALAARRRTRV